MTPSVTVVLPSRNGAGTIGRQLDAFARQSADEPWELLVADNGSTDGTRRIVESFAGRLPQLRIVDAREKPGVSFACNVGVREARGDAIAFCNDDDEVDEGWVAAMGRALHSHELVAGKLEHERLNDPWILAVRGRPQEDGLLHWTFGGHLPFAAGAALGIRRSLHERIGGFDEELVPAGEDMDYCWRAQYAGAELRFVPDAVTHYRFRQGLKEIYGQGRNYGVGNVLVYRKHRRLGMPPVPHPWRAGARAWMATAKQGLLAVDKVHQGRFLWYFGWRMGMLQASARHRVVLF